MRICLVVHGFPPVERTGVENYTLGLARALARAGQRVEVFVPRRSPQLADRALRREERDGYAVNWITNNQVPAGPREALLVPEMKSAFAAFLDRERPEVVHFQHLVKLGIGLVEVAQARGIPTVYTAHDYYAICHRYTLLRPDLTRCDARGDALACARCDLALGHLNARPELGDYQMGVLPGQLSAPDHATLQHILAARPGEDGPAGAALAEAHERRRELDALRAKAYRAFDLVLAPSRFLIDELVRGGFQRERIEYQPYGLDNADLEGLPPVRRDPGRPVRFAFLGGLSKHKGVHVLLEAFAELRAGAELSIWGDSSDRPYVERLRQRTSELGALWRGPYERADLPHILREIDALVVPSIWLENHPLVIREGFAAGRPVLASRVGALPENVRDGVDGLLFEPGDAHDLARVMRRCVEEAGLLEELARGSVPGPGVEQQAAELIERYQRLGAQDGRRPAPVGLPLSLKAPLARFQQLSDLPTRELLAGVLSGLDRLRAAWAVELDGAAAVELLALGLGAGSAAQDRLREARNEVAWLRGQLLDANSEITWLRAKKEELDGGLERERQLLEERERETSARLRELGSWAAPKDAHLREVEGQLQEAGRYIRRKEQEVRELGGELGRVAADARAKESELRAAQANQQALERGTRSVAEVGRVALAAQDRVLGLFLRPILERVHQLSRSSGEVQLPAEGAPFAELMGALRQVLDGLGAVEEELEWRRPMEGELAWYRERLEKIGRFLDKPVPRLTLGWTTVGREIRDWQAGPPPQGGASR